MTEPTPDPGFTEALIELSTLLRVPMESRAVTVGLESGLFALLAQTPCPRDVAVSRMGWNPDTADVFLNALIALGHVSERSGALVASARIHALLSRQRFVLGVVRDWSLAFEDAVSLPRLLVSGDSSRLRLQEKWQYKNQTAGSEMPGVKAASEYSSDMDSSIGIHAENVIKSLPWWESLAGQSLVDFGGGKGGFCAEVTKSNPGVRCRVYDLPTVKDTFLESRPLSGDSIEFIPGDFLTTPVEPQADCVSLIRVLWDWNDADVSKILATAFASLMPGGKLLVYESMYTGDPEWDRRTASQSLQHLFFGGRIRTATRVMELCEKAGFSNPHVRSTSIPRYSIIEASR